MKKEQVDPDNALARISDSKTPNGVGEIPLTEVALDAFRDQIRVAGTIRFATHVRNPTQCRRGGGRVGDATAAAGDLRRYSRNTRR
jgi:hypothetical protein